MCIGMRALSPAKQENLVRWPPKDYHFMEPVNKHFGQVSCNEKEELGLKRLFPELGHWSNRSISSCWDDFAQWATWGDFPEPTERDEFFLAYIYLDQELGLGYPNHGGLDEFDSEWSAIGK